MFGHFYTYYVSLPSFNWYYHKIINNDPDWIDEVLTFSPTHILFKYGVRMILVDRKDNFAYFDDRHLINVLHNKE